MTAEVVNLRRARKRKTREAQERDAAANRVAHGVAKGARATSDALRRQDAVRLDGHRRELLPQSDLADDT